MTIDTVDGRATWPFEPLYKFLHAALPDWHRPDGTLDIPLVADELGISAEAIYKWLRKGQLPNATRARQLFEMSQRQRRESAPELGSFYEFSA